MSILKSIKKKLYTINEYGVEYQNPNARLDKQDVEWLAKEYDIRTDVHRSCINCQARQMIKYGGTLDSNNKPIKDFRVPCKGIPKSLPPGSAKTLKRMVAEENMEPARAELLLKSTIDPVAWATLMFGFDDADPTWHLRSYQKEQLRCTSEKLVVREGRRSGKTFIVALKLLYLAMNREVQKGFKEDGTPNIGGPEIMVITPFSSQLLNIFDEMEKLLKRNSDLMKRCKTASGGSAYVKTPFFHMDFSNGAKINGFVSGVATKSDGSGGGTMRGRNANIIYLDEMDMIPEVTINKVVLPILLTDLKGEVMLIATSTPIGKRAKFYEWCFPPSTLVETPSGQYSFSDVHTHKMQVLNGSGVRVSPSDYVVGDYDGPLISIDSYYRPQILTTPGHPVWADGQWVPAHKLQAGMELFVPEPQVQRGSPSVLPGSMNYLIADVEKTTHATAAQQSGNVAKYARENRLPRRSLFYWIQCLNEHRVVADRRKIAGNEVAAAFYDNWYRTFNAEDAWVLGLYLAEGSVIRTKKYHSGVKWTLKNTETALAERVCKWAWARGFEPVLRDRSDIDSTIEVILNTSWLGRLFEVHVGISHEKEIPNWFDPQFTNDLLAGLLAGDGHSRKYCDWTVTLTAKKVLTRLDQLLRSQGVLASLSFGERDGKKPTATLHSVSGRYSKKVDGGWLVKIKALGDVDYQGPVYNLEVPGTNDYSVGFRVHNCLEDPTFKEDHLPSTVLPQWEKNKHIFESEGSKEDFQKEYMAQFVDTAYGVFKPSYVYSSMKDYNYKDCLNPTFLRKNLGVLDPDKLVICIGIDWNKNAGTEYLVVGYDPLQNKFIILDVVNVEASDFSSLRWKEEVIRLNYKWKPDYIYADEGYGHTIIEDLKVLSQQMSMGPKKTPRDVETAKIKDRLISFNFSSKVELRNPLDGTPIKKSGKEFLVEFTIRVLEQGMLCMPSEEEHLRRQMLNYVVLKRSPTTNKPVYGAESDRVGDHRLDALMLALGGVQLENGLYSDANLASSTPSLMSKDFLDERAAHRESRDEGPAGEILASIKRQQTSFPGAIELLQALRPGETPAEAAARRDSGSQARVGRRSRGRMAGEEQSVREWLKSKAKDYRGYADDTEHLYQNESPSSHVVGPKRRRKRSGRIKRRR